MKPPAHISEKTPSPHRMAIPVTLLVVLLSTRFGGFFSLPPNNISAFWPANALLFSAVFFLPPALGWMTLLLALPAYAGAELWIGYPLRNAIVYGFANVAEVTVLIWLMRQTATRSLAFDRLRDLFLLLSLALVASTVGGAIGAMEATRTGGAFGTVFLRWSLADYFGYCLFVPLVLTWRHWRQTFVLESLAETMEFAALLIILLLVSVWSSGFRFMGLSVPLGAQFLPLPVLLWAALRFGPPGGAIATVIVACIAFFSATRGAGLFAAGDPEENVASLQLFFATLVISVMTIASLNAERKKSFHALRQEVAERKHAEDEVRRLNRELEHRVEQRTARLEAANKELAAFSYSVSHDLRAPLRHIDGFLGLLKERIAPALDDESRRYMATISEAAVRMGALIDDLLSFSRSGRFEMVRTQVDLGDLAKEVVREFEPETKDRIVQWQIAEIPVVTGDRAMLRAVLVNLISNALKFTRSRAQAEIAIGCLPEHKTETVVFVRDNGVGFDMQYAGKLFGVFDRLHGVDEFEGTGIGLANVRRVIERHGGRTWAEGKVDGGATFYFSLPRSSDDDRRPNR